MPTSLKRADPPKPLQLPSKVPPGIPLHLSPTPPQVLIPRDQEVKKPLTFKFPSLSAQYQLNWEKKKKTKIITSPSAVYLVPDFVCFATDAL